ncbi:MAG: hypothetical protein AAB505_01115, partial [Patescibacteria group bacterium]
DPWFVLPASTRLREIKLDQPLPVGWYRATLTLNRGYGDIVDERFLNLVIWSWSTALAGLLLILVLVCGLIIIFRRRERREIIGHLILLATGLFFSQSALRAEVSSSTNYRLQADSLNFAGLLSTSTNYRIEDTLGEIGTGTSSSATYRIRAGYQNMLGSSIAISAPSDLTLSTLGSGTGGQSSGSVAWTVTTDNEAGYTLALRADASPALRSSGGSFDDYTPAGAVPDYSWSAAAGGAEFGFSPEGSDVASRYLDNGVICGTGSGETTDRCWDGLSTSNQTVSNRTSANTPSGTVTTVKLQAEITAGRNQTAGSYSTTLTATALAS